MELMYMWYMIKPKGKDRAAGYRDHQQQQVDRWEYMVNIDMNIYSAQVAAHQVAAHQICWGM